MPGSKVQLASPGSRVTLPVAASSNNFSSRGDYDGQPAEIIVTILNKGTFFNWYELAKMKQETERRWLIEN